MRLANYYFGVYPLTYITTTMGTNVRKVASVISNSYNCREGESRLEEDNKDRLIRS